MLSETRGNPHRVVPRIKDRGTLGMLTLGNSLVSDSFDSCGAAVPAARPGEVQFSPVCHRQATGPGEIQLSPAMCPKKIISIYGCANSPPQR